MKRNLNPIAPYAFPYPGIVALQYETHRQATLPYGDETITEEPADGDTDYHIALYKSGNIVSWLMLTPLKKGILQIEQRYLGVDDDCKALEDKLLEYVEKWAQQRHFGRILLNACHIGKKYYEKRGFEPLGEPFMKGSILQQKMLKFL